MICSLDPSLYMHAEQSKHRFLHWFYIEAFEQKKEREANAYMHSH